MEIRCSIYKGYRQPMPVKTESLSWNRFCDYFVGGEWLEKAKSKGVTYPEKKNLPCYGFYLLKPETSRANENVVQIYAIGMDFDSGDNVEDVEAIFGDWRCATYRS